MTREEIEQLKTGEDRKKYLAVYKKTNRKSCRTITIFRSYNKIGITTP